MGAMYSVTHATEVEASETVVWRVLSDLESASRWNPIVASSKVVGASRRGVGAVRESQLSDGEGHLKERVIDWSEGKWITTEITDTTLPLSTATIMIGVEPAGTGRSAVVVVMEYEPKRQALGRFGGVLALRGRLCRVSHKMIEGLKRASEEALAAGVPANLPLRPARA
jgi:hypothetical protein